MGDRPADCWQEEAICAVCLDLFADPAILDCGHNVCLKCADQLCHFQGSPRGFFGGRSAPSSIKCPECRQATPLPPEGAEGLKRNHTLRNLVARLQAERSAERPAVTCGVCEERAATAECRECGFELCPDCCATQHQRGKYKSHTVVPLGQWARVRPAPCPDHHKDLDLYCVVDQRAVCIYCLQLSDAHHRHRVISVADAVRQARSQEELGTLITSAQERVASLATTVEGNRTLTEQVERQYQSLCQMIRDYFEEVQAAATARATELLEEAAALKDTAAAQLSAGGKKGQALLGQLQGTLANCEGRVRDATDADLLKQKVKMVARLQAMLELPAGPTDPMAVGGPQPPVWRFHGDAALASAIRAAGTLQHPGARHCPGPTTRKRTAEAARTSGPPPPPSGPDLDPILSLKISDDPRPPADGPRRSGPLDTGLAPLLGLDLLGPLSQATQDPAPVVDASALLAPREETPEAKRRKPHSPPKPPARPSTPPSRWELKI
jgi:HPt (histidine-containing phosphotransfer) domain-containing protein